MTERHPTANSCQRARRARYPRIDYYPSLEAQAIVRANLGAYYPDNILSGVLNRIVIEWADVSGQRAGIKYGEVKSPMTSASPAGVLMPARAHANEFGEAQPEFSPASHACASANESGIDLPPWVETSLAASKSKLVAGRVNCGARRHSNGQPCRAKSEPGKQRCKWHGGCSTGPRTDDGKTRALANLKQNHPAIKVEQ